MAHKKGQGHSSNGRDSASKRLGVKRYGGQFVMAGSVLVEKNLDMYSRQKKKFCCLVLRAQELWRQ